MSFVSRCGHFECGWRRSTAYCLSGSGHEVHYAVGIFNKDGSCVMQNTPKCSSFKKCAKDVPV